MYSLHRSLKVADDNNVTHKASHPSQTVREYTFATADTVDDSECNFETLENWEKDVDFDDAEKGFEIAEVDLQNGLALNKSKYVWGPRNSYSPKHNLNKCV